MRHPTARRLVAITLLSALMGCKLIDKIRNRGNNDADAGGTTTTVTVNPSTTPILVDGGGVNVAIPLPNPTVAPNPSEIPTPSADAAAPGADSDAAAVPTPPPVEADAGAAAAPPPAEPTPPAAAGNAGGTVPERIEACNQQHAADGPALAQCLQAIIPDADSTRDMAALAEAMWSTDNREARSAMRRDAMRLMDRYTRVVTRGSTYERFKTRLQGGR